MRIRRPVDVVGTRDSQWVCSSGKPRSSKSVLGRNFRLVAGDILRPLGATLIGGSEGKGAEGDVVGATSDRMSGDGKSAEGGVAKAA